MTALPVRTPFEPLPRVPAEAPLAVAVIAGALPFLAWAFDQVEPTALGRGAAIGAACCAGLCVAAAVRGSLRVAGASLAGAVGLVLAVAYESSRDALVSAMCSIPVALAFLVALGPLALVARARRVEPDALEHHAVAGAAWLAVVAALVGPSMARAPHVAAEVLAVGALGRDLFRAWWLVRARRGAIAGVRVGAPWPGASARVDIVHTGGDGPFRTGERLDRSDIVEVRWARMVVAVAVLVVLAVA